MRLRMRPSRIQSHPPQAIADPSVLVRPRVAGAKRTQERNEGRLVPCRWPIGRMTKRSQFRSAPIVVKSRARQGLRRTTKRTQRRTSTHDTAPKDPEAPAQNEPIVRMGNSATDRDRARSKVGTPRTKRTHLTAAGRL